MDNTNKRPLIFDNSFLIIARSLGSSFNDDNTLNWEEWSLAGLDNPLEGNYNNSVTTTNNLITNLSLSYELISNLRFKTNLGYTSFDSEENIKLPRRSYNPAEAIDNSSSHLYTKRKSWIIEPQLIYNTSIGKLSIESIIGATLQENNSNRIRFQGSGYSSEVLIGNLAAAERILNAESVTTEYRYRKTIPTGNRFWPSARFRIVEITESKKDK